MSPPLLFGVVLLAACGEQSSALDMELNAPNVAEVPEPSGETDTAEQEETQEGAQDAPPEQAKAVDPAVESADSQGEPAAGGGPEAATVQQLDAGAEHDHSTHSHGSVYDAGADASLTPPTGTVTGDFVWDLPSGFPLPRVSADDPMSSAKVELGRRLFYDKRLSDNQTFACATCHEQKRAFTDGLATPKGSTGVQLARNSMALANVGYASTLTWANGLQTELHRQAFIPIFGDAPKELGQPSMAALEARLASISYYKTAFAEAFPDAGVQVSTDHVTRSLAAFQRTLISGRAPFDSYLQRGDEAAISEAAKRGYALFNSEKFECFHCHGGFNFSDAVVWEGLSAELARPPFHNTGLYNLDGLGAYPEPNTGLHNVTGNPRDMGKFKAPSLRNVAVTAPYMHDGSIATLSEVLDHYAAGGRTIESGPLRGVGSKSPLKDPLVVGFALEGTERADLVAFLESLTDAQFLADPRFSDPWK
jgi:cytochrome c peroxidase